MTNVSNLNGTADDVVYNSEKELPPLLTALNIVLGLVAAVIFVGDIFAVAVMRRCTRIPFQTQKLSICFILSDALGALAFLVHQMVIFVFGINTDLTHNTRIVCVGMMLSVSWFSVAALALDRAIALSANLRYATLIRRRTINVAIVVIWTFHVFSVPVVFVHGLNKVCGLRIDEHCDIWAATKAVRIFKMSLLIIVGITVVGSNAYVHKIARYHERQIADMKNTSTKGFEITPISERQFSATKAVITIVLAFVLLHAPIIIHLIVLESNVEGRDDQTRRLFHAFSYTCIQINSFVSLRLYAGKFKEFKMHLYSLLGVFFKTCDKKAENLRVDVYNIVVSSDTAKK